MSDTEKRSIQRHPLKEYIRLEGGSSVIKGRTVDVSRNGMKILVESSEDFGPLTNVSVNLPGTGGEGIPCHVRRSSRGDNHWEIGLEFDGETEARMLLVERWLESLEKHSGISDSAPTESRQVPRTRCTLEDIRCTDESIKVLSVEDISLDGMLVRIDGNMKKGDTIPLAIRLNSSDREIGFQAKIAFIAEDGRTAGLAIAEMKEIDRNRLRSFIVDIASGVAMLEYHRLLEQEEPDLEFRIEGTDAADLISRVIEERPTVNVLDEAGLRIFETHLEKGIAEGFRAQVPGSDDAGTSAFFSFSLSGAAFTFSTGRFGRDSEGFSLFEIPQTIYRGEKRTGRRKTEKDETQAILLFEEAEIPTTILESSRRGLLCEFQVGESPETPNLKIGKTVILLREAEKRIPCEIRHIDEIRTETGETVTRIGLETDIQRGDLNLQAYSEEDWERAWNGRQRPLEDTELVRPRIVNYDDGRGRNIVALLHLLRPDEPCTAVIIPPAFGKKKEVLAPLALTLMTHFAEAGENVAILRYDGIDRPGESDNSNRHTRRGYEMLGYRIDQGYVDLVASMRWVKENPFFNAEKTVVISFSMSALDARRLQSDPSAAQADYWISVMGVSSSQGALRNILGGLDVIGNHRMGMPIGTMGMLGQLVDMDRLSSDMIRLGYASASDAREAMARIDTPITWIYGAYDKWMIPEEIRDVMSIAAKGLREVIEVPTAHNLRTSDDALSAFQLISDSILRRLRNREIPTVTPDKTELLDLITRERERITGSEDLDTRRYWKGYLIGENEGDEGYDFYGKLKEFRDFMELEAELLDPKPGESIADMGCGTGLVSQALLYRLAAVDRNLKGTSFTAFDLVNEALEKARMKYTALTETHSNLKLVETHWRTMDLEPDPLAAIRRCIKSGNAVSAEDIRDRVRGLNAETTDRLTELPSQIVVAVLTGEHLDPERLSDMDRLLPVEDVMICRDLNLVARFLKGDILDTDLKPSLRTGTPRLDADTLKKLRTSDLQFSVLDFGSWTQNGQLEVEDEEFDGICASLFLSYLFAPGEAVKEFFRMLKPEGRLLLSTMKPDSDISGIFTAYIAEQSTLSSKKTDNENKEKNLREARSMLNEAAALFSLEEDGWFRFFDTSELVTMMREAGFSDIRVTESLGKPEQAIIVTGKKKNV